MAWPTNSAVTTPEQVFKTPQQVAHHKTGLKILAWGAEDTMKTGFALSCPAPVYLLDTELGAPPLFQYFPKKDIQWCDATYLNPETDMSDPFVALQRLETTISLLKDIKSGTVVIDSGTDVWDWIQAWIEGVGKHKEGTLLRFEWSKAKNRWRQLILRLMAKPLHFVMTAQPQEIYDSEGRATGTYRPRIQQASSHVFDIIIHTMKWETRDPKTMAVSTRYVSEVTKCRFKKGWRKQIEEVTYEKLTTALKAELGVEVW